LRPRLPAGAYGFGLGASSVAAAALGLGRGSLRARVKSEPTLSRPLALLRCASYDFEVFRPCIDLHEGKVKQIVGGSLSDASGDVRTNFVSEKSSAEFAELYRRDELRGGHVILLGPGNETAARAALAAYPGGMQVGGGVHLDNAAGWLNAGASQVIVTSWVFRAGRVDFERLASLSREIGKQRLVLDLSCRRRGDDYWVVTDRWQTFTDVTISAQTLSRLAEFCDEFLVHAVDVEGLCRGIDVELVTRLAAEAPIPVTYAGGASSLADLELVSELGQGRIDLTIGSALDIFGGSGVRYADAVAFNRRRARQI
jgi:phosphoribosylformimino-5-aminoimidazole carboxamide ribotide isomerase